MRCENVGLGELYWTRYVELKCDKYKRAETGKTENFQLFYLASYEKINWIIFVRLDETNEKLFLFSL